MEILLVDDEPFALKLLTHQLSSLGCRSVTSFERAIEALTELEHGSVSVDLIFCDLQMPEMDGVQFLRYLARIGYLGDLVLVSGESSRILQSAQKLAKAHALNVLGVLHKPVKVGQLQAMIVKKRANTYIKPQPENKTYAACDLHRAILQDELVNYYQPKVSIADGKVHGVETLVRWQHPKDGLVYPNQFIQLAEQHGVINDLTQSVLKSAINQIRHWQESGLDLHVAVNVSMHNIATLDFPDRLAEIAANAGVTLSSLILEITESSLMKDRLASLDILTRLRLKRISLSIDDFGTGHSSLAQLRDVPFDELKIDRGFVHEAWSDSSLRAMFEASLSMAHKLDIRTIAEGVEDDNDWAFLRASDCDFAQGYFIARPMPAKDLKPWIEEWNERLHSGFPTGHTA